MESASSCQHVFRKGKQMEHKHEMKHGNKHENIQRKWRRRKIATLLTMYNCKKIQFSEYGAGIPL